MTVTKKLGTAELLYGCARQMGLQPTWITPKGLFAISVQGKEQYINYARSPLNSHTGASLSKNKYLTRMVLARHGEQNIPFLLPRTYAAAAFFQQTHGKVIAKPVQGSGARDIHIVTNPEQLRELSTSHYILEKYVVGDELRYLVLNGKVIGVHRSDYGTSIAETRPLRRISYRESEWDATLLASSIRVAAVLGLHFVAVDYLIDRAGRSYVLEVNTNPGLKWFHAPTSGPVVDVAGKFLEAITENARKTNNPSLKPLIGSKPIRAYS